MGQGQAPEGQAPQGRLFRKLLPATQLPRLEAEAEGLAALALVAGELVLPRVHGCGLVAGGTQAELLLEWLDLSGGGSAGWAALGGGLAQMHRRGSGEAFGWRGDRFIGAGPQLGGWSENWGQFFAERRLAPQFALAAQRGLHWSGSGALLQRLPTWLNGHGAEPVLVHGDLWAGNAGVLADGRGSLFDPAVSFSDREVDLAMAQLFGGFPKTFFDAYNSEWPLPAGHRQRRDIYNLFHLLNHANLFAGGYRQQCTALIEALLALD
ncbi:MAG: fructosamine kinase family protein [Synechococcus lacustris]